MKKLLTILIILFSLHGFAQYDSTKLLQPQNGYGSSWKNAKVRYSLIIPNDTPHLALKDSGAVAYKVAKSWLWNGHKWITQTGGSISNLSAKFPIIYSSDTLRLDTSTALTGATSLYQNSLKWGINGNAGTGSTNFIGTTDAQALRFKVNNVPYGLFSATANYNMALGYNSQLVNTSVYATSFGAYTLAANTTGNLNNAFGYGALRANTTGSWNNAFGYNALVNNITGVSNTAFGHLAGAAITGTGSSAFGFDALSNGVSSGAYNTAVGYNSMFYNGAGYNNTGAGASTLYNNTTGHDNTGIGSHAADSNTTGSYNTALGSNALLKAMMVDDNTAIGYNASAANSSGNVNTAVGSQALQTNTIGGGNTSIGAYSMAASTTGYWNTALGWASMYSNTTGHENTAFGEKALYTNTTGIFNTALGAAALYNSTGSRNVAVGDFALLGIITGNFNTALGEDVRYVNDGSYNTMFGNRAGYNSTGDSNTYIGFQGGYRSVGNRKFYLSADSTHNLMFGDFNTGQLRINAAGFPQTINSSAQLEVTSTNRGLLIPRMSAAQAAAIATKAHGLLVYILDSSSTFQYDSVLAVWKNLYNAGGSGGSGSPFGIANSVGVQQFTVAQGDDLRVRGDNNIAVTYDAPTKAVIITDAIPPIGIANSLGTQQFTVAGGADLRIRGDSNIAVSFEAGTKTLVIANTPGLGGGSGANNYLSSVMFSGGTLTFARNGLGDLTQSIDGRYTKISDTASMLTPYLRSNVAAATYATPAQVALKNNISDTASMLSPYLRNNIAAATYATISQNALKNNISDTASMLSHYLRSNIAAATYATISQNALKNNISDTASMLSPYLRTNIAAATYATVSQNALKVNISDTSTMLSKYLRKIDTTAMLSGYLKKSVGIVNGYVLNDSTLRLKRGDSANVDIAFSTPLSPTTVLVKNVTSSNAGNTNENTVYTGTIPANSIGPNGHFEIHVLQSFTTPANTNSKTLKVKFGTDVLINRALTTAALSDRVDYAIYNRNSMSSQVATGATAGNSVFGGTSGNALATYSINTAAAITVTITLQNAVAGDVSAIEAFNVVAYP